MRRFAKSIAFLVAAAQLLLAVPAIATASSAATACAGMAAEAHNDGCPCCPDGVESMKDCLASCTLFAAVPMPVVVPQASMQADFVEAMPGQLLTVASPPPLKPPPIF